MKEETSTEIISTNFNTTGIQTHKISESEWILGAWWCWAKGGGIIWMLTEFSYF